MAYAHAAAYRHIRSFRREDGGLYSVYVAIGSRVYRHRMLWLHKRGRHAAPRQDSISPRCSWCGHAELPRQHH